MAIYQSLIFFALFVPAVAIALHAVLAAYHAPYRERPMITGGTWSIGDYRSDEGTDGGEGGWQATERADRV